MTDRKQALIDLRDRLKAGETPNQDEFRAVFGWHKDQRHQLAVIACDSSDIRAMGAAKALHEAALPGWGWRVCECYLSDDAAVFPDFNCPQHGERLRCSFDESVDWFDLTDVDQRPAGNPARAWLLAILEALIAEESS